jgi:hypothetical protein
MKYSANQNAIIIDLDEARYLARQNPSWNNNTLLDAKITAAKAVLKLYDAAKSDSKVGRKVAYGESTEL